MCESKQNWLFKSSRNLPMVSSKKDHSYCRTFDCTVCEFRFDGSETDPNKLANHTLIHPTTEPCNCSLTDHISYSKECTTSDHSLDLDIANIFFESSENVKENKVPLSGESIPEITELCKFVKIETGEFHELKDKPSYIMHSPNLFQNSESKVEDDSSKISRKYSFVLPNSENSSLIEPKRENNIINNINILQDSTYNDVKIEEHSSVLDNINNKKLPKNSQINRNCNFESSVVKNSKKEYRCEKCGIKFKSQALMNRHMSVHTNEKPFACLFCVTRFKRNYDATRHMKRHMMDKTLKCTACFLEVKDPYLLISHKMYSVDCRKNMTKREFDMLDSKCMSPKERGCQKIDTQSKQFQCSYCDVFFANKSQLYRHKRKFHTEHYKRHTCSECSFSSRSAKCLMNHTNKHKLNVCNVCNKRFAFQYILKRHKLIHSKEKTYICCECGSSYKRLGDLVRHRLVHTDYSKFNCSKCQLNFNDMLKLKEHITMHT